MRLLLHQLAGGSVTAGLAIHATMQSTGLPRFHACRARREDGGAADGVREDGGKPWSHSTMMIISRCGAQGQAVDLEIQVREILRMREEWNNIFVRHSGQKIAKIEKDTDRDMFMSPEQAVEYGLIDEVIVRRGSSK